MIMFITPGNHQYFSDILDRYFQKRYDIFIKKKGWKISNTDGRERDQFDTLDAAHIVWEENGVILGGARMLSTHRPYLLGDVFPYLLDDNVPRDKDVWEITRLFLDIPINFESQDSNPINKLLNAIFDFCFLMQAKKVVALTNPHMEKVMREIGIPWVRTGPVHAVPEGGQMVAGESDISLHICEAVRAYIKPDTVVSWMPITPNLLVSHKKANYLSFLQKNIN